MTFFFGKIEPGYHDIQKHSTVLLHVDTSVSSCEALGNMRGYVGCLEQHGMVGIPWNQTPEVQDQSLGGWMFYPKKASLPLKKWQRVPIGWHLKNRNLNPSFTLVGRNEAANALTAKNRSGCSELTRIMSQLKSPAETQTVSDLHRII